MLEYILPEVSQPWLEEQREHTLTLCAAVQTHPHDALFFKYPDGDAFLPITRADVATYIYRRDENGKEWTYEADGIDYAYMVAKLESHVWEYWRDFYLKGVSVSGENYPGLDWFKGKSPAFLQPVHFQMRRGAEQTPNFD